MPNVEKHAPGAFCWIEPAADQNGARSAAAAYTINETMCAEGVPPHWDLYVAVNDAEECARRAAELGAPTYVPPMSMANIGRFAVLADPQGAAFAIFQSQ